MQSQVRAETDIGKNQIVRGNILTKTAHPGTIVTIYVHYWYPQPQGGVKGNYDERGKPVSKGDIVFNLLAMMRLQRQQISSDGA